MITRNIRLNMLCIKSLLTHIPTRYLIECNIVRSRSEMNVYPMITVLNILNISPFNNLAKKYTIITCVGQCCTFISPLYILFFTKKYLICIYVLIFPYINCVHFSPYASRFDFLDRSHFIYTITFCTHEHHEPYIVWDVFSHSYQLGLCGDFHIYLFLPIFSVYYSIPNWYCIPCMYYHILMQSLRCIYTHV